MNDIFSLLDNVQKGDSLSVNDRVLIVDGLNLYLRVFARFIIIFNKKSI